VFGAEATKLGEVARAVRGRVVGGGRRDGGLIRILAEQELVFDLAREGRFGANAPRRSDHDRQERDDRSAYDDPYDELQHA
jgi:hypothetical protein